MLALKAKRSNKTLYLFAAVIVTAIAVIMAERQGVVDSDYFWHITLGKSIWQNKAIPTQDTFSWLGPELNLQETAHSWLGSLILYAFSCISTNPVYGMLAFIGVTVFAYCLFIEYIWGRFMSYSTDTGMEDCLNQFDFDAILLRRSQSGPCIEFMNQLSGWTQGYKDDYFVVFVPFET